LTRGWKNDPEIITFLQQFDQTESGAQATSPPESPKNHPPDSHSSGKHKES
jgi:hypothetical protein